jgi:Do/DeqQ family serine protease
MNFKRIAFTVFISAATALSAVMVYDHFRPADRVAIMESQIPTHLTSMALMNSSSAQPIDFRYAAAASTPCVVHVKSIIKAERVAYQRGISPQELFGNDFFQFFQGPNPYQRQQDQMATGSGVIVSKDGYVVTNNHVVEGASDIEVVMQNNKSYKAKVVGRDPDTDIALLKLDGDNFPSITFANSDSVLVGEWVLAVGNPFNLASTVTAGIVSAKGRNLNMIGDGEGREKTNTAIESFIQTDAAVNPGNSGGALVNVNGQLVGINTAIASPTGSYAGYSFAVPSNIVRKMILDLKEFGTSQRGYLGVTIRTLDDKTAKDLNLDISEGAYVDGVNKGSAGEEGGLKSKDVITKINGFPVVSSPELQEQVAKYRPGDKITVEYIRDGKVQTTTVQLKNKYNTVAVVDNTKDILNELGLKVENLTEKEKASLGVSSGVRITDLKTGKISQFTDIRRGFVITQIDDQPVNNVDDLVNILKEKSGKVMVEGIYPNRPESYLYAFRM